VHSRLQPGEPCAELKQLKEQFVIFTVFFKKWEQSFRTLFPDGFVGGVDEDFRRISFEVGWLIFLLARAHAKRSDIVNIFPVLLHVVHLLLAHLPPAAKTAKFWQELEAEVPVECYPLPAHALSELCNRHKLQVGDLLTKTSEMTAVEEIVQRVLHLTTPTATVAGRDGGGDGFKGFLCQATLYATRDALDREYDQVWSRRSQLDGRFFFTEQPPSRRIALSSVPVSPNVPQRSLGGSCTPMLTPQRHANPLCSRTGGMPQTPISSHLESKQWLEDVVTPLEAQPRSELLDFFAACQDNPAEDIHKRLQERCRQVSEQFSEIMETTKEVEELVMLSRKLYYKMLLVFLQAEQQRLNVNNFGKLLANDSFHCSLLACCMEAVIAAKSAEEAAFPSVLELLDLHAFDFCKVIESFIKTDPRLPGHLRSHFADVEAKILESLAWADGSPLHGLMHEYDAANGAGEASPRPSRAKVALEQFIKKVWYLAAVRIQDICTRLLLPSSLVHQVWDCLKVVLKQVRHLLIGRHLDQIVMCTVYGVCKVNQRSVTFRHIIEQYKRQPMASPKVFREVRMTRKGEKPQDIICFYNQIYIPSMKEHLMQIVSTPSVAEGGASSIDGTPASPSLGVLTRGGASPQRVSEQRDVYVSQPRTPSSMTPRTKTLYSFGDTPAAKLETINSQLRSTGSDGAAMHALHQMRSSTLQHGLLPSSQVAEEEASETGGRKRSLNLSQDLKGSGGRQIMQRRLDQLGGGAIDRSSSQGDADEADLGKTDP